MTRSFRDARINFVTNLTNLLEKLDYTPASLAMKMNSAALTSGSSKSVVSASDISSWLENKKVPSLYAYFKLCDFLHVDLGEFLTKRFSVEDATGRTFARRDTGRTTIGEIMKELTESETVTLLLPPEETKVAPVEVSVELEVESVPTPFIPLSLPELRRTCVAKHTSSVETANLKLAYAVLTSDRSLVSIAEAVGASTRSMRDYMYYGTSVPAHIARRLRTLLKAPNFAHLGLKFDSNMARYIHV